LKKPQLSQKKVFLNNQWKLKKKDIKKQCKEQLRTMKTIKLSNSAKWLKKLSVPLPPPLKTLHLENKMILKSTA